MLGWIVGAFMAQAVADPHAGDRNWEGDWYIADSTDNNTGERQVYAFQSYIKRDDPNYMTLTMRCSGGVPKLFVSWTNITLSDQTVIAFGPLATPDSEPAEKPYIFERSPEITEDGHFATAEVSAQIIKAIGAAPYLTVKVHSTYGAKMLALDVRGTQRAWARVVRHCPVRKYPLPPI